MSASAGGWLDQAPAGQQNLVLYLFIDHAGRKAPPLGGPR
jgi:hypothetical protein